MTEEGKKKRSCQQTGQKIEEYTRKTAAAMQMIGLQAPMLYLQTEEAYFSVFLFSFFHPLFLVLSLLTYASVLSQNALLNSTENDEIMHHSFVDDCSTRIVQSPITCI